MVCVVKWERGEKQVVLEVWERSAEKDVYLGLCWNDTVQVKTCCSFL